MKTKIENSIYKDIDNYYSDKLEKYGASAKGVDWNSEKSQIVRFEQLSKIIQIERSTINDIGCGYGKYLEYLIKNNKIIHYKGYDLSEAMIKAASKQFPKNKFYHISNLDEIDNAEYSISSGIFNNLEVLLTYQPIKSTESLNLALVASLLFVSFLYCSHVPTTACE